MHNLFDIHVRRNEILLASMAHTTMDYVQVNSSWFLHYNRFKYPMPYYPCMCSESDLCFRSEVFYPLYSNESQTSTDPIVIVPGLFSDCYPIDKLRLSSLECFYNQSCVDMIVRHRDYGMEGCIINWRVPFVVALDSTQTS